MSAPALFDVIGPVMIGPSSSHTAGVARICFLARKAFGERPEKARVTFHGSLAATWRGHGSDKAAFAGLLGLHPEDERLSFARELAAREGLVVDIVADKEGGAHLHPNTLRVELEAGGRKLSISGCSIGGGAVRVENVNGFPASISGELDAVLVRHRDRPGVIAGVTGILAEAGVNIATAASRRNQKGDEALLVVELDGVPPGSALAEIRALPEVLAAVHLPSVVS
ncbi:MAG: L-serine ammonia-lyase, iron-sulfur-dependent subunit beta [Spirochaetales bacterium]|nr:L-serine ammonia-lyase, iron-sulfur-dependent subunit beta [Spirochaetales bacterium]